MDELARMLAAATGQGPESEPGGSLPPLPDADLASDAPERQLPPQPVRDLSPKYFERVATLVREAEAEALSDKVAAVRRLLDGAVIPGEFSEASPLRLPYLAPIAAPSGSVTSLAQVPAGLLHLFCHLQVPLTHGALAQWYAPPPLVEESVEQLSTFPSTEGVAPLLSDAVLGRRLALLCPRVDEASAFGLQQQGSSSSGGAGASSSEVVDSLGALFVGPHFSAWLRALVDAFTTAAALLKSMPASTSSSSPSSLWGSSSGSGSGSAEASMGVQAEIVLKLAAFCGYVPWSYPPLAEAAQRLLCALAKATSCPSLPAACPYCSKEAGKGKAEQYPFLPPNGLPPIAGKATSTAVGPLSEPLTCAHALVAANADALLARCRAAMAGDAWCSTSSASSGSSLLPFLSRHVAFWVVTHLRSSSSSSSPQAIALDLRRLTGHALPMLLKMLDRWEATNIWLGASGVCHLLLHASASDLRVHRELIVDSLNRSRAAASKTATALHAVCFAKCLALPVLYGPPPALPSPAELSSSSIRGPPGSAVGLHVETARALAALTASLQQRERAPQTMHRGESSSSFASFSASAFSEEAQALLAEAFMGAGQGSSAAPVAVTTSFVSPYDALLEDVMRDISLSMSNPGKAQALMALLPVAVSYLAWDGNKGGAAKTSPAPTPAPRPRLSRHLHQLLSLASRVLTDSSDAALLLMACHCLRTCVALDPGSFTAAPSSSSWSSSSSSSSAGHSQLANRYIAQIISAVAVAKEQLLVGLCGFRPPYGDDHYGSVMSSCGGVEAEAASRKLVATAMSYGLDGAGREAVEPDSAAVRSMLFALSHFDALVRELEAVNSEQVSKALQRVQHQLEEAAVTADVKGSE